jgi:hypothetical protein
MAREGVTVAADGTIPGVRWLIDHDRQLKITLAECSACHTRVLPDGSIVRGAQRNLQWGSLPQFSFDALDEIRRREGRTRPPNEVAYSSYGVPWLKDDINATLKTMTAEQVGQCRRRGVPGHVRQIQREPVVHDQDRGPDRRQRPAVSRRDRDPSQSRA